MSRVFILSVFLAIGYLSAMGVVIAEDPPQVPIEVGTHPDNSRFAFLDILDSDSRSKQFADLRTKRSDITRNIFRFEQNLREAQASAESLQKAIQEFKARPDYAFPPYTSISSTSKSELDRQTFEREQEINSFEAAIAQVDRDIAALQARPTPDPDETQAQIRDLENRKLRYADSNKIALAKIDFEIERVKKSIQENSEIQAQFDQQAAEREKESKISLEKLESELSAKTNEVASLKETISHSQSLLDVIDAEIVSLIDLSDADSQFKITISMTFAFLVLAIILGFFYIANSSSAIIESIFSNDSGIQFITLFSIVIAVILFGIIGVLEGKELSALLGGLSGYILGRGANNLPRDGNRPETKQRPPTIGNQPTTSETTPQPAPPAGTGTGIGGT
ncbi:hypothetical protein DFR52_1011141 [Hoeflea marina]|uniref:Uncharacterized protein n=1 Tax=Hoeflea marina TaxID=274592 RepID=A0A317PSK7_9HYPH|nr:hypothetical protein [Hoeflea marina]PWW04443.1 hypothetical protein DFR52_1011141 [Hoeflea marina]